MAFMGWMADFIQHAQQLGDMGGWQPLTDAAGPLFTRRCGHDFIDLIDQPPKHRCSVIAGMFESDRQLGFHPPRITFQNHHPVGDHQRFFDAVRHHQDGAGRNLPLQP